MTKHRPRAVPLGARQFIEALLRQFGFDARVPPDGRAIEMLRERDTRMRSQGARGAWPDRRKIKRRHSLPSFLDSGDKVVVIADEREKTSE